MPSNLSEQLVDLIPRMRRFASGLSGCTDHGDELVQAACERLLRNQARLRPETRLDSWLYRVIRNLHIDGIRAQSVRDRGAETLREVAEIHQTSNNTIDDQIQLHEVHAELLKLSAEHREVLLLVAVEGLSYKEAAEVLNIPIGTVTSRLIRARNSLIARMGIENNESVLEATR